MNALRTIFVATTLCTLPLHCMEITIRQAEKHDLPAIEELDRAVMFDHFKPTIMAGYPDSPIAQDEQLLDEFLNGYLIMRKINFCMALNKPNNTNLSCYVASESSQRGKICGFCMDEKKDHKKLYIHHLAVAKKSRGEGIGSKLLMNAIATHDNITSCELHTLAYANEKVHHFYEKHGFSSTKDLVTVDPRTPNTHISYSLDLKK